MDGFDRQPWEGEDLQKQKQRKQAVSVITKETPVPGFLATKPFQRGIRDIVGMSTHASGDIVIAL